MRFRIDFGVDEAVGPGKIALLEHISTSGSLSQAARDLKMSYARAWKLLESLNVCFVKPVAVMSTGGRGGGGAAGGEVEFVIEVFVPRLQVVHSKMIANNGNEVTFFCRQRAY